MTLNPWLVAVAVASTPAATRAAPEERVDAFLAHRGASGTPTPTRTLARLATVAHAEPRLGVPTFVWAARPGPVTRAVLGDLSGLRPEVAARRHLFELAELYRLRAEDVAAARVRSVHDTGFGGLIVSFRQEVEGYDVFRSDLAVLMNREHELIAISGYFAPGAAGQKDWARRFHLAAPTTASLALEASTGANVDPSLFKAVPGDFGGYSKLQLDPALSARLKQAPLIPLRTRPVLFRTARALLPAYYVEVKTGSADSAGSRYFSYVISAADGQLLFKNDLTHSATFSYRAWADPAAPYLPDDGPQATAGSPHPTGLPDGYQAPFAVAPLVTLEHAGLSTQDPWLPAGATATTGNNVDAYADLGSPDGFSAGDLRAETTSAGAFDYSYDVALAPGANATQQKAAVVNLFYANNFFHDWYYDFGFDEASGNAQTSNLGRGGLANDCLLAEGQDYSGRDNSDMQVPADGANPTMQMYVFTGNGTRVLSVTSPPAVAGTKTFGLADFGPTAFDVAAELVLVDDGTAPTSDACQPAVNTTALAGKVALVDRGTCTFQEKAAAAQAAGAAAVLIANNQQGGPMPLYGGDPSITIPVMSVSQATGAALSAQLTAGTAVMVHLSSTAGVDRDGTLDTAIVAHEWGHYISNRLIGDANGLSNGQGWGMGEGWGDFHSLLMVVRATDAAVPANANWTGVYALATYTSSGGGNNGYYYGIRRVPYSTDFTKDPLTYKHIQDGVALPSTVPIAFGADGSSNSESHSSGEVWATMLWECYAALLSASPRLTFQEAQYRMKSYLVAGYKLTPDVPTFLEARDAVLAAALAADSADFVALAQAFARRGAGVGATGPDRASYDNVGVVESFVSGGDLELVNATLSDSVSSCDDDGVLDNTETGRLTVTLKNTGTAALAGTTATASSAEPALVFANGGQLTFPATQPFEVVTATLEVGLSGVSGSRRVPVTLAFTDPGLAVPRTVTATFVVRLNYDDLAATSATDDVESPKTHWTVAHDAQLDTSEPFRRVEDADGAHWFGPDPAATSDQTLVSPPLHVTLGGHFLITFRHRYSFESDGEGNFFDGAVIELRKDGGAWTDIGTLADPPYPGTLSAGTTTAHGYFFPSANPLGGRNAFVGDSPGYPEYHATTVDLGGLYGGSTVQVRFRIGGDENASAVGWDLDDIAFQGIEDLPFNTVAPGHASCGNQPPAANAGPDQTVDEDTAVTLTSASTDPDGDALTATWTQTSGPAVTLASQSAAAVAFTAPEVAGDTTLTFQLEVNDGRVSSGPATANVRVKNVNHRPTAAAGADKAVDERVSVRLSGSGIDADHDALAFHWEQVAGPAVELAGADSPNPTFVAPEVSGDTPLVFALTVSDGQAASEPATVEVTVRDVKAPKGLFGCGCTSDGAGNAFWALAAALALASAHRRRAR